LRGKYLISNLRRVTIVMGVRDTACLGLKAVATPAILSHLNLGKACRQTPGAGFLFALAIARPLHAANSRGELNQ